MLNASVGVQRVLDRVRTGPTRRSSIAISLQRRSLVATRRASRRLGHDAALPLAVAAIMLVGTVLSVLPDALPSGPVGGPSGDGPEPRVAAVGVLGDAEAWDMADAWAGREAPTRVTNLRPIDPEAYALAEEPDPTAPVEGPFLADGTLVKPVSVETTVRDGKGLLREHRVQAGESLTGIANQYGVSMMTVWWANKLTSKDALKVGQVLTIPSVNGLVVTVREGDTLESLAASNKVAADDIFTVNKLDDRVLIIGQTLVIPGAVGEPIPTPTPKPTPKPVARTRTSSGAVSGPATYGGGAFAWPVVGGGNYISQYFHYGHYGLDIAATHGSTVRAAAGGTVIFAGWKSNGGGYQVHISHGSNLYTTYNHMSAVTVGRGQSVGKGQQVGRIGQTGWATGPHLHFEVWRGGIWNGGKRVNPLIYL